VTMDGIPRVTERDEIRRLLRYLRPYVPRLAFGVLLIAAMGVVEFLVAFALRPAFDVVLNPHSTTQALTLFQIPYTSHVVDLHSFALAISTMCGPSLLSRWYSSGS